MRASIFRHKSCSPSRDETHDDGESPITSTNFTPPEKILWPWLRDRRMCGEKFRRQHPVKPYFLDFACEDLMLAFELDGAGHQLQMDYDAERDKFLEDAGWKVLRIGNHHVVCELHAVLEMIRLEIEKRREELGVR